MRLSRLFGRTLRESPAEAEAVSHALLLRAGMIRPLRAGIYSYLPLGWRVIHKMAGIIRQEMEAIGGQELHMPPPHRVEVGQQTSSSQGQAVDLGYERSIMDLARREISSYRQLPFMVYQIQSRLRDEPRPRGGLIRARESIVKDGCSFHADEADLDAYSLRVHQAYLNIFRRCALEPLVVQGAGRTEFVLLNRGGDIILVRCQGCGYAANLEDAVAAKGAVGVEEELREIEEVATPGVNTIAGLAEYLGLPTSRTAKAVFYVADGEFIFVVIRGDLEVNEAKLARMLGGKTFRAATEEEIRAVGAVPGYASPVGLEGVRVVADDSIPSSHNLVAGANREGYHLRNVNYPRDFTAHLVADIALVREGDACPHCGEALKLKRGLELGHILKLGTRYSQTLGVTFLDRGGQARPLAMGCYGINLSRLMAAVVETHHDEQGIIWPPSLAPYQIHLVALSLNDPAVVEAAEGLYADLRAGDHEVLYDDRDESAGIKFNDADLIGLPLRLTISRRTLARDGVEAKRRWEAEPHIIAFDQLEDQLKQLLE
ncbi:MAG: proline--tRNA ligase [Anaerolineae bacterium]